MKFIIQNKEVEFKKEDLVRLEYHCSDVGYYKNPYLLLCTKTEDIRVDYATEFRKIYDYFTKHNLEIRNS